jgi:hypothetical protein
MTSYLIEAYYVKLCCRVIQTKHACMIRSSTDRYTVYYKPIYVRDFIFELRAFMRTHTYALQSIYTRIGVCLILFKCMTL